MSGCHHPISFEKGHVINVNTLQYHSIIGSEKARILVNSCENFTQGDPVTIREVSVNEGKPTGKFIQRFVLYVESRVPLYSDDDYLAIHLVPARCMIEALQK